MFPKEKYNTDISRNAQNLALFRRPSDRKEIGIVGERMFDNKRIRFMNAYYQETEKPFGYLLVDNKLDTPADKQVLRDLFGSGNAMFVASVCVKRRLKLPVEPKPAGKKSKQYSTLSQKLSPQEKSLCKPLLGRMSQSMSG